MNVTFETTPNPSTMKFNFSSAIADGAFEFPNVESTEKSPLAAKIFGFPWVSTVFIGENFVTITKQDWVDWKVLAQPLSGLLAEHVTSGQPVVLDLVRSNDEQTEDSEIIKRMKRVLNNEIKPVVALDGGDIAFVKFEDSKLYIKMMGSCVGCPSSEATLKQGIEVRIREVFPEVSEVIAV